MVEEKRVFIWGKCLRDQTLFCAAWDGTKSGPNLKKKNCALQTCGYARQGFPTEPLRVSKSEVQGAKEG